MFTNQWFDKHIGNWQKYVIYNLPMKSKILELGSYEGRSSIWIYNNIVLPKNGILYCVDHWIDNELENRFNINTKNIEIQKNKISFLPFLLNNINEHKQYELIYLDGDHNGKAVLQYCVLCWLLLSKNGIMVIDDYKWKLPQNKQHKYTELKVGIDAFLAAYNKEFTILHHDYQVILKKNEN
jgi:predicted O-methyltransferase YrrM